MKNINIAMILWLIVLVFLAFLLQSQHWVTGTVLDMLTLALAVIGLLGLFAIGGFI